MIIDGKKIAEGVKDKIKAGLESLSQKKSTPLNIRMGVVLIGDNPVSLKYVEKKKKIGEELKVSVKIFQFEKNITEEELSARIPDISAECDGIIIQLPLPEHLDTDKILNLIPKNKDIDCLSEACVLEGTILSPVVLAIREILKNGGINQANKLRAVVIGRGRLVGKPILKWLVKEGANVESFDKDSDREIMLGALLKADLVILCAGQPGMIKPNMIRDGVILIDAATSDVMGQLKGDADPECASKSFLFTPVPGGVGPITVMMLFKNLIFFWKKNNNLPL